MMMPDHAVREYQQRNATILSYGLQQAPGATSIEYLREILDRKISLCSNICKTCPGSSERMALCLPDRNQKIHKPYEEAFEKCHSSKLYRYKILTSYSFITRQKTWDCF